MKYILILEDDLIIQRLYKRVLAATYNTVIVATIAEAVASLNAAPPDVFVSDMRVPDGCGAEAVAFCQAKHPTVPIIIVSGTLDDAKHLTVFRKFEKPFSPEDLAVAIQAAL